MLWFILFVLILFAIAGGVAVNKLLFLILVLAFFWWLFAVRPGRRVP